MKTEYIEIEAHSVLGTDVILYPTKYTGQYYCFKEDGKYWSNKNFELLPDSGNPYYKNKAYRWHGNKKIKIKIKRVSQKLIDQKYLEKLNEK